MLSLQFQLGMLPNDLPENLRGGGPAAGSCVIVAYNQKLHDELIGLDGAEELPVPVAPVGKVV